MITLSIQQMVHVSTDVSYYDTLTEHWNFCSFQLKRRPAMTATSSASSTQRNAYLCSGIVMVAMTVMMKQMRGTVSIRTMSTVMQTSSSVPRARNVYIHLGFVIRMLTVQMDLMN